MILIDVFAVVLLAIFTVLGVRSNFINELVKILVLLLVFLIVYFVHPLLIEQLERFLKIGMGVNRAIFLLLFLALAWLLGKVATGILKAVSTFENSKVTSYVISGFAGTVRGVIYLGTVLWLITSAAPGSEAASIIEKGKVTKVCQSAVMETYDFLDRFIRKNNITPHMLDDNVFDLRRDADEVERGLEGAEREIEGVLNRR